MSKDRVLLTYILESINNIEDIAGASRLAVDTNQHHRAAILYYLQTLAESTQRLSAELKAKIPKSTGKGLAGFVIALCMDI